MITKKQMRKRISDLKKELKELTNLNHTRCETLYAYRTIEDYIYRTWNEDGKAEELIKHTKKSVFTAMANELYKKYKNQLQPVKMANGDLILIFDIKIAEEKTMFDIKYIKSKDFIINRRLEK